MEILGIPTAAGEPADPVLRIPLYSTNVSAGFPSPAQDHIERTLDLNELCIQHPAATFFVRVEGDSMIEAGINAGDVLVVDRSLKARSGDIVIASLFGDLTVKELSLAEGNPRLIPRNASMLPIEITPESGFQVLGVVTYVIHGCRQ